MSWPGLQSRTRLFCGMGGSGDLTSGLWFWFYLELSIVLTDPVLLCVWTWSVYWSLYFGCCQCCEELWGCFSLIRDINLPPPPLQQPSSHLKNLVLSLRFFNVFWGSLSQECKTKTIQCGVSYDMVIGAEGLGLKAYGWMVILTVRGVSFC